MDDAFQIDGKIPKVLVVDDAPSVCGLIKDTLIPDRVVRTASSGEEALEIIESYQPDLVLLDVSMPGIDGYEVCRRIRSRKELGFIKIIMVSSGAALADRLKGYEAGADDYIVKPFKQPELLAKVEVFLRLKKAEDQLDQWNKILNEQIRIRTKQLLEAEKLAALGRYAAGIVHNLNSPLQVIMGNAELLAMRKPDNRNIMNLRKAAGQMKKIIGTILTTCHQESRAESVDIDMNQLIFDQIELLKSNPFFKHHIEIDLNLNPLPLFQGTYHHFSQILSNLIQNAIDAMYNRAYRKLSIYTNYEDGDIVIQVTDTGVGISPQYIKKIFNPFFTTKPLTATDDRPTGTGLGLASSKEMIESYGGNIQVMSKPEKGTTFTIRLPVNKPVNK